MAPNKVCAERSAESGRVFDHCWHASQPPFQTPPSGAMFFYGVCCFCAPEYMKLTVYIDPRATDEQVVEIQMMHGPLVVVERMPKKAGIASVDGRTIL